MFDWVFFAGNVDCEMRVEMVIYAGLLSFCDLNRFSIRCFYCMLFVFCGFFFVFVFFFFDFFVVDLGVLVCLGALK